MPNRRFATALAAALADLGVEHACISPGSRNTPLIAGFATEPRIQKWPLLDERSAGFFAIGLAKASGKPVVLVCTSGTAATEYHPAVVEASQSDVPLLVMTADRPKELRNVGAPQTIDQVSLFGSAVRWFVDVDAPDPSTDATAPVALATEAWHTAISSSPGPVHLNLAFREPLLETGRPPEPTATLPIPPTGTPQPDLAHIAARLDGRKGLIVAGHTNDGEFPAACADLAARTGFPIIADPLTGIRFGEHSLKNVLAHGDQLAASGALDTLRPEVVVRFGPVPTSKPVWAWMAANPTVEQILIDPKCRDATHSATTTVDLPVTPSAAAIADAVVTAAPPDWLASWSRLDAAAAQLVTETIADAPFPNEPMIATMVTQLAPAGSVLTIGSSMPIRDVDAFGGKSSRRLQLLGNRGANGIDGVLSAALGTAATGANAIVLLGDVSLFHDLNALGTAAQLNLPITIVVVNNNGGGIFHFLPQRDPDLLDPEVFERLLATPHGTDFVPLAQAFGVDAHRVDHRDTLAGLLASAPPGPRLIQIETDRDENLALHRRVAGGLKALLR